MAAKLNTEHITEIKKYKRRALNLCGQINKTQENAMAGTEKSTLILGQLNIIVKVCVSLKRLLIVTFNIKTIRIQSSKCSHPVKLSFGGIRSLRFINQPNLYVFKKPLVITL